MSFSRRCLPLAALLMAGAALAQPPGGRGRGGGGTRYADPSGVIAAEMAMGRLSTEKGEWAALAKAGTKDAILFAPEPVFAQRWLKGQRASAVSVRWQTQTVFMSCDGNEAVSIGNWVRSDGRRGRYSTIWRRDPKAGFQWVLTENGPPVAHQERDADALDEISAPVAQCKRRERPPSGGDERDKRKDKGRADPDPATMLDVRQPVPMNREDKSQDGSLRWRWVVAPDKSRALDIWMATEDGEAQIVSDRNPPPSGSSPTPS